MTRTTPKRKKPIVSIDATVIIDGNKRHRTLPALRELQERLEAEIRYWESLRLQVGPIDDGAVRRSFDRCQEAISVCKDWAL